MTPPNGSLNGSSPTHSESMLNKWSMLARHVKVAGGQVKITDSELNYCGAWRPKPHHSKAATVMAPCLIFLIPCAALGSGCRCFGRHPSSFRRKGQTRCRVLRIEVHLSIARFRLPKLSWHEMRREWDKNGRYEARKHTDRSHTSTLTRLKRNSNFGSALSSRLES
jgi:hypothetical protein